MALPKRPKILSKAYSKLSDEEKKEYDRAKLEYNRAIREYFNLIFAYTSPVKKPERKIVGRDDLMQSMLAAFARPELSNVLLLAEAGSGKALVDDTEILVADNRGFVPISEIQVGDMVFDKDGEACLVQGVFPQGEIGAYELTLDDERTITCNGEHLWRTDSGKTISTDEIRVGETSIPISAPIHLPERSYSIDPYVVGTMIAACQTSAPYVNLSRVPEGVVEKFAKLCSIPNYKFEQHSKRWIFYKDEFLQGRPLRIYNNEILKDKEFSVVLGYDSHKKIPESYMFGSIEQRTSLLQALMDCSGLVFIDADGPHCIFGTDSKFLVEDVKRLAASLGIASTVKKNPYFKQLRKRFITEFYPSCAEVKNMFSVRERLDTAEDVLKKDIFSKKTSFTFIKKEQLLEQKSMTCIAVDSPTHCFLATRDYVVTHNTALVQGLSALDKDRIYLEVDLARMIAAMPDANALAAALKLLFDQVAEYNAVSNAKEAVLFMDEFHQIVQISAVAVEALKPLLADSGTRGIRVICATTYREFRDNISKNQPLVERLQRINVPEPDKETTVQILKGMAERYGVKQDFWSDQMFDLIYEYTERYVPANAQPRKSLLVLDAMIGWHRSANRPFDRKLLADVLYESEGVNVAFRVDAAKIKENLDARVYAQDYATTTIARRLQLCVADLNDHSKPMSSMLFTGSTGVGKAVSKDTIVPVADEENAFKLAGDVKVGDFLFNRQGKPTKVVGVYPQGKLPAYNVYFDDSRVLTVSSDHLWKVYEKTVNGYVSSVMTTEQLMHKPEKMYVDLCVPVEWVDTNPVKSPYTMGALYRTVFGSYGPSFTPTQVRNFLRRNFPDYNSEYIVQAMLQETIIPEYRYSNPDDRMKFIRGLFQASSISELVFKGVSKKIANDIQSMLFSLGIPAEVFHPGKTWRNESRIYTVRVRPDFIRANNLLDSPYDSYTSASAKEYLGIDYIEALRSPEEMVCFEVEDPEHLFLAGPFIVTHNTETVKQLVNLLFGDERAMIRMDMTEFANAESIERFRDDLTTRVWEHQHSVILLDEIEKAHESITKLLLQVLDDGRLTDRNGREVSFLNTYIVMTTNVASEIYKTVAQYRESDTGSHESMADFDKVIRRSIMSTAGDEKFPPELLGRIDIIVPFQPLSDATRRKIVLNKLIKLRNEIEAKHRVEMRVSERVVDYLVGDVLDVDSDSGGARAVVSKLEEEVTCSVAEFINLNPGIRTIQVDIEGELASENKTSRTSDAHVLVRAVRSK